MTTFLVTPDIELNARVLMQEDLNLALTSAAQVVKKIIHPKTTPNYKHLEMWDFDGWRVNFLYKYAQALNNEYRKRFNKSKHDPKPIGVLRNKVKDIAPNHNSFNWMQIHYPAGAFNPHIPVYSEEFYESMKAQLIRKNEKWYRYIFKTNDIPFNETYLLLDEVIYQ